MQHFFVPKKPRKSRLERLVKFERSGRGEIIFSSYILCYSSTLYMNHPINESNIKNHHSHPRNQQIARYPTNAVFFEDEKTFSLLDCLMRSSLLEVQKEPESSGKLKTKDMQLASRSHQAKPALGSGFEPLSLLFSNSLLIATGDRRDLRVDWTDELTR